MDPILKELVAPALLVVITAISSYVFGKQKYKRDVSGTALAEAQDSEQMLLLTTLREREQEALKREQLAQSLYLQARDDLMRTQGKLANDVGRLERLGERRDELIARQGKQLAVFARLISAARPELREVIEESGFVALDDFTPRRKTDPSALPGPLRLKLEDER